MTKPKDSKVWIVIPAYNEEATIGRVIDSLKAEGWKNILVVNDGSTDRTARIARERGACVVSHPKNVGLGGALRTGLSEVYHRGADVAVTFDADGQHHPKDVKKLVRVLSSGNYDLVIGLRKSIGIPLHKRFGNFFLNLATFLLTGVYTDSQSGSRAFSRKALEKIQLKSKGYEVSSEILLRASRNRLRIGSVPVVCYYPPHAKAKGTTILSGIKIFLSLVAFRLASV